MPFQTYLLEQLKKHPSIQPQDVLKLCYQAAFGAEHLLQDMERAKAYLQQEYETVPAAEKPLFEEISDEIVRVDLSAWKFYGLPAEWLFSMLAASPFAEAGEAVFRDYLKQAEVVLEAASFSQSDWQAYLQEYEKTGLSPVHHSPIYREQEKPAYRIVNKKFVRIFPILQEAAKQQGEVCVIAIDGRAASGKTTMTTMLQAVLQAEVVQMDDFFLPPELRTEKRLAEPGGNVHYERFQAEVLPHLSQAAPFSYRRFDCSQMDYHGSRAVGESRFRIVEGSYSHHPAFGEYAHIKVYSFVDGEEQLKRIEKRNGSRMAEMFRTRWIPLEEAYFETYGIRRKADLEV